MTVQEMLAPQRRRSRGRRWVWLVLVCLALVLLVALVVIGWTWRHPSAFERDGAWGMGRTDVKSGSTVYVTATDPNGYPSGSVTIHGAAPHDLTDSTAATYAYVLCTPGSGPAVVGIETAAEMRGACDHLAPAAGATMSLRGEQLMVAITPRRAGMIRFHGVALHYTDGWQNGTQYTGPDVSIRVSSK